MVGADLRLFVHVCGGLRRFINQVPGSPDLNRTSGGGDLTFEARDCISCNDHGTRVRDHYSYFLLRV